MIQHRLGFALALLFAAALVPWFVTAQEPPAVVEPAKEPVVPAKEPEPAKEPVAPPKEPVPKQPAPNPLEPGGKVDVPLAGPAAADTTIREQTIYIPYTKLRQTFEKEGRGVFIPYEKFQALWRAAREDKIRAPDSKPPIDALIAEIESEATVGKDTVNVTARLKIEILTDGWHEVPLNLNDAAILSAKIGDEAARIIHHPQTGYTLLVEKTDKTPAQVELVLQYAKAISKTPGQNSVVFQAPQSPVNRWRIKIPEAGIKVNIHPLIAATEVPSEPQPVVKPVGAVPLAPANAVALAQADELPKQVEPAKQADPPKVNPAEVKPVKLDETVVMAFVGSTPTVRIDWTPKAEGASGLAALATVQSQQEVTVDEGAIRTRTRLTYDISRAELSQLVLEVPGDHKVVNVFDPNVRQWAVEKAGELQKLTVQLFEPTRGSQNITIELEKFTGDMQMQDVVVPVVKALDVGRQQGVVVVRLAADLRAEPSKRTGLLQLDAAELPKTLSSGEWAFAYRYAALPFELTLSVEKVKPRIQVDELVEAYLEPEQITLNLLALYTIERAGVFQLEIDVPAGYEVRQVRGQAAAGAQEALVDSHHLEGENKTRLLVTLGRKATGKVGLFLELQKRLQDPNLLTPNGQSSEIALAIPRVAPASVERSSGRLVVYAPESLRVNPSKQDGLGTISFTEAFLNTESVRGARFPLARPVLGFGFHREAVGLTLSVERRKPHVTVRQLLVAQIEEGVAKYTATFYYDIRYSSVKSLRIDVPLKLAAEIRNLSAGVREKAIEPPPANVAPGYVAWSLAGETDFIGSAVISLAWEAKIDKLEVGKSVDLELAHLRPMDVDRAWGQIVLTKAETIDVNAAGDPRGLRPIDPQHDLMEGASVPGAARAFEFHEDWALKITATQYKLENVKRTSIERAVLRMVVTRSNQITVQALYRMRSARQRLAVALPAEAKFDTDPLLINGRSVSLEHGDQKEFYIPLVGQNPETPFLVELRYTVAGDASRLDFPEFLNEPAVQKVYLCAYLPEELALLGSKGPWTDEQSWRFYSLFAKPYSLHSDAALGNWVREGVNVGGSGENFQTAGKLYVFSALRPEASPAGSLRLTTLDEDWLRTFVFLAIALLGLALVRRPLSDRLLAGAILLIGLVLAGVFAPTFSMQILNGILLLALVLVVVLWGVVYLGFSRSRFATAAPATFQTIHTTTAAAVPSSMFEPTSPPSAPPPESSSPPTGPTPPEGPAENKPDTGAPGDTGTSGDAGREGGPHA